MAIRTSNQITFTEHKKIVEIKEWYLATSLETGVTKDTDGWTTSIQTMDDTNKYLWNYEEVVYSIGSSDISEPIIIGIYNKGEAGLSGASLQVKYISSQTCPDITDNDVSSWSDTVPTPENGHSVYMIQKLSNEENWSAPIKISAIDGQDGTAPEMSIVDGYWYVNGESTNVKAEGVDGKGISSIKNYYATTQMADTPPGDWTESVSDAQLSHDNKYLWNYEEITYTDNTTTETDPAIIGVYGDSGADAVDFQIYSTDGFEFSDVLKPIELKTIAFQNGEKISDDNVTYQWKWWNSELAGDDKYVPIEGKTSANLTVYLNDVYALNSLKCEFTYDGVTYEDHISLTKKTQIYLPTFCLAVLMDEISILRITPQLCISEETSDRSPAL